MSVLVTNNHLQYLGGSETFTYTLVKEIQRREGDVDVFTFHRSDTFKELPFVTKLKEEYDIIFVNHNTCLKHVIKHTKGFKFLTCHGTVPDLEQPVEGADHYVSISEEVQAHLRSKGFESTIIRNGVDCERFKPIKPINKECKNVFCLCQGTEATENIREACKRLGLNFFNIDGKDFPIGHNNKKSYFNVEEYMGHRTFVWVTPICCGYGLTTWNAPSLLLG